MYHHLQLERTTNTYSLMTGLPEIVGSVTRNTLYWLIADPALHIQN